MSDTCAAPRQLKGYAYEKTIAIMNNKGRDGKTITAATMARCLSVEYDKQAVPMDAEQQGNLPQYFGVIDTSSCGNAWTLLTEGADYWPGFVTPAGPNLDMIPFGMEPPRKRGGGSILILCAHGVGLAVVYLQLRAGSPGDDGVCLSFGMLRLALELGHRRNVVPGLGMRPIRTGHAFLCHSVHLLQTRLWTMDCISFREAACLAWSTTRSRSSADSAAKRRMACSCSASVIINPTGISFIKITSGSVCPEFGRNRR